MDMLDMIYLTILVVSIPYGHIVKSAGNPFMKKLLCFAGGMSIVITLVGLKGMVHSFIAVFGNFLLIKICGPRSCHYLSFYFIFGYLSFYRLCGSLGFPAPPKHSNAVQLLVTLRMINMAFECHDASEQKKTDENNVNGLKIKKDFSAPMFDYFAYGYCYIGLMTGPFYTYQSFKDMVHQDGTKISTVWPALRNLKYLSIFAIPYLVLKEQFPLSYLESDECLQRGFFHILLVMAFTLMWFRWRFYIGWLLAESMCISAGLGAYPYECGSKPGLGPTQGIPKNFDADKSAKDNNGDTHDFTTIHNIEIYACETGDSMRNITKVWNMTVQWWMATYVYKKLPIKSVQLRVISLYCVSAYWHGLHPGYYAAFLSAPLFFIAETRISKRLTPYLNESQQYWFSYVKWFFVWRYFEYIAVPFMYLKFEVLFKIWSSIYFVGHISTILFILLSYIIPEKKSLDKDSGKAD